MKQLVDNRYRIVRPLGSGGMADVYLAHDDVLDRDVALKVMSGRYASDDEFVERFKREAQSAAALSHPNIVSIYDRGESEDGTYYIAMEYLPGGTLKDRILKRGALQPRTAAAVALQIAQALQAAHKTGVVHRDIKPHNILITESGDLKVTDFGIARAASSSTMTRTGAVLGTAHYISPEQAMGEAVGPASDLYSLGVVLYEMLTGELPYDADTPIGIAMKHVNGHLRPPKELNPQVPAGLNAIALRLLAKDPEDRYADSAELIEDLERVAGGLEPLGAATTRMMTRPAPATSPTRVGPPLPPSERSKKRRTVLPFLLGLAVLVLLALLAWAGYTLLSPQPAPLLPVPELEGMTLDEARSQVGEDFEIARAGESNSNRPEDTILSQDPAGGRAEQGSTIDVTVASGQNDVPDVRGNTQEQAAQTLGDAGFEVKVEEQVSSQEEEGRILDQSPDGGESADLGSEVRIAVGSGPETVKVPDIPYGATASEAESMLRDTGLELGSISEAPNNSIAKGGVIDQNPRPDVEVEKGSSVDIVLSSGPQQVTVPDVIGDDVEAAKQAMLGSGLGYRAAEVKSNKPAGEVIATNPKPGEEVDAGTQVEIRYSSGSTPKPGPKDDEKNGGERGNGKD